MRPGTRILELARHHPMLATGWFGVLGAVAAAGLLTGDRRVWAYIIVLLILTACLASADKAARFSPGLVRLLILAGTLHMAGGLLPEPFGPGILYDQWLIPGVLRFDQVVHTVGSFAAAWVSWQLVGAYLDLERTPARAQALIAFLGGMGKGALNEVFEFLTAAGVPGGSAAGGYLNTEWDLVFDAVGCLAAVLFLVQSRAPRRTELQELAVPCLIVVNGPRSGFAAGGEA